VNSNSNTTTIVVLKIVIQLQLILFKSILRHLEHRMQKKESGSPLISPQTLIILAVVAPKTRVNNPLIDCSSCNYQKRRIQLINPRVTVVAVPPKQKITKIRVKSLKATSNFPPLSLPKPKRNHSQKNEFIVFNKQEQIQRIIHRKISTKMGNISKNTKIKMNYFHRSHLILPPRLVSTPKR